MSKFKKRIVLFLIIIMAASLGIKGKTLLPYKAEPLFQVKTDQEIMNMGILKGGVLATFDGDRLAFYDRQGRKKTVDRLGEGQRHFSARPTPCSTTKTWTKWRSSAKTEKKNKLTASTAPI